MLGRRRLMILARRTWSEFKADNCPQLSAGVSYYALFAIFPLFIFIAGSAGLVLRDPDVQRDLVNSILESIPLEGDGQEDLAEVIDGLGEGSSGFIGLFGLVLAAWSASALFGTVRHSVELAFDVESRRPFVPQKLIDLGMVVGLAPFFLVSIALTGSMALARDGLEHLPVVSLVAEIGVLWVATGLALSAATSFVAFSALYCLVPAGRIPFSCAWPGAALATVLFEIAKLGFSFYLKNFGNYDAVLGTLGVGVGLLVWVNLSSNILMLGAELASEYPRVWRGDYDDQPPKVRQSLRLRVKEMLLGLFRAKPGPKP